MPCRGNSAWQNVLLKRSDLTEVDERRIKALEYFQKRIGYVFNDESILNTALTHSSYVKCENKSAVHNERLEFLGDAVLELCVSEKLFNENPQMNEGTMTRIRSLAVYEDALVRVAKRMDVGSVLLISNGEERTGGREKPSILSDAVEAVIGAIYVDGGYSAAKKFILGFANLSIQEAMSMVSIKDYKTMLQEHMQKLHLGDLTYVLVDESGPEHKKMFTMAVVSNGETIGTGSGGSKQEAGKAAAHDELIKMNVLKD